MDKAVAQQIRSLMLDVTIRLDDSVGAATDHCREEEIRPYRDAVERIKEIMSHEILDPLYDAHPDLKPSSPSGDAVQEGPIPCPFVYPNGRPCHGFVRMARAYGPHRPGRPISRTEVGKYRLWCSDKDDHAGVLATPEAKQRMEFYPGQLPPGVEDRLWAEGLLH
jgi:hypothetical protein